MQSVVNLGTTRELVHEEIHWVQRVGNCERNHHAKTGVECAVLVEDWGTILERVQLCIQKKSSKSGGRDYDFVLIAIRLDTTSRPVHFCIPNELSNENAEWIGPEFVRCVEKLVTTFAHVPQSTLPPLRNEGGESQCEERGHVESVAKQVTMPEPVQVPINSVERIRFLATHWAHWM